jgi:hypothetical protein
LQSKTNSCISKLITLMHAVSRFRTLCENKCLIMWIQTQNWQLIDKTHIVTYVIARRQASHSYADEFFLTFDWSVKLISLSPSIALDPVPARLDGIRRKPEIIRPGDENSAPFLGPFPLSVSEYMYDADANPWSREPCSKQASQG